MTSSLASSAPAARAGRRARAHDPPARGRAQARMQCRTRRAQHRGCHPQCGRTGQTCRRRYAVAGGKGMAAGPARAASHGPLTFARRRLRFPCPPPAPHPSTIERRHSAIAAIPLTAVHTARAAAVPTARPARGGASIRRAPPPGRLGEAGAPAAGGSAGTRKPGVEHLERRGRTDESAHAGRDITSGLAARGTAPAQIKHYCKRRIGIPSLPAGRRTAMTQGAGAKRPLPGSSAAKRGLNACPVHRGAGTPGTPVRRTDRERGARCAFTGLGME